MTLAPPPDTRDGRAGELLRRWRQHRRLSQLELSVQVDVSTRHLSFVETGRARPSRDMVLRLAEHLEIPLRERNQVLLAAGHAPVYRECGLDEPQMRSVREALRMVLRGHHPYPAVVVDRMWHMCDATPSLSLFTAGLPAHLLEPPVNVLRASLHPDGMAGRIVNLAQWRAHVLHRLHRQVLITSDPEVLCLYEELCGYGPPEHAASPVPGPGDVAVPLVLRHGDAVLSFISTVATFGTAVDITVAELSIESFYPADQHTAEVLRALA